MRVISPLDLRRSLGAILDAAAAGERFVVERDRRPLAMLVSVADGRRLEPDPADARRRRLEALARLERLAARQAVVMPPAALPRAEPPPRAERPPRPVGRAPSADLPQAADRAPAGPGSPAAAPRPAEHPPAPSGPTPVAATAAPERLDRHRAERVRHAGEDLVGLG
jgi:antitoxin (DNA-binding transcriptional repressor) of toxin-antitoxin stability system